MKSNKNEVDQKKAVSDLKQLIRGFQFSQAIHVAAVLRIADHMSSELRASNDIAKEVGAHPPTLYRLLRALAAIGVFREDDQRRFSLTAMGACLRSDSRTPLGPRAVLIGQAENWNTWGHLLHSIKTGENAFQSIHGEGIWTHRERHPEKNDIFNAAMTSSSRRSNQAIVKAVDFDRFQCIADIGGGQGSLLAAILSAYHKPHGVIFDQPHVIPSAWQVMEAAGIGNRCEVHSGDMFEAVPSGCDAYILKNVLHDWDDTQCVQILQTCCRAMVPGAVIHVIERLVGPPNEDPDIKFSDLHMLVSPGGQKRTLEEFVSLFNKGGLRLTDTIKTESSHSIMIGELL